MKPKGHCPILPCQDYWSLGISIFEMLSGGHMPWGRLQGEQLVAHACPDGVKRGIDELLGYANFSPGLKVSGRQRGEGLGGL